jgi:hypothetical protein
LSTKDDGCEIYDTPIRQKNTQHLLFLSLTLLKSYIDVKRITFLDNSKYECRLSNGSKSIIFMNQYYYLFHGGTWYDLKTGAVPKNPDERVKYEEAKTFFTNPSKKKSFDFRNPSLEKEFGPIYEKAETWREFLDVIYKKRGPDFCEKILPWYSYATGILADNRLLPGYWVIETITPIPFTRIATTRVAIGGSRRKYKKRTETYDVLSPSELYELAL